jgi:hypothetical protein
LLVACGGSDSTPAGDADDDGVTESGVSASGVSQKGPFRAGGSAEAVRLASDGTLTSEQVSGTIDDRGEYELTGIDWTGPTRIRMEGTFFDEVTGNFSSQSRALTALSEAEEGSALDANVNLFTHFAEARIRFLMGQGDSFTDARDTATADLQQALGITSAPEDLNLLEAIDSVSEDSANLLLFSAAAQKGGIDQTGIDELASDFADDGQFNGNGADEMQTILDEGTDSLLSDARLALQNQYSTEPPSGGSGGGSGFGWTLSACAAAKLTEPRVFCSGENYEGTKGSDDGEAILFFPEESGFYAFSMDGDELSLFANWTLKKDSLSGTEVGDSSEKYGDTTTFALKANDQYAFDLYLLGLSAADDSFTLSGDRVSDGRALDPVELEAGSTYAARVGYAFSGDGGAARSWYRLDSGAGSHTIRTSGYPADAGSGGMRIEVYRGNKGQETVNDLNSLPRVDFVNGSGTSSNELTVDLVADRPHFILITNLFTDYRRETMGGETTGFIEFDLTVTKN